MELAISEDIFTELDRCTSSEKFLDFIMPKSIDTSISVYSSEDDIDIDD